VGDHGNLSAVEHAGPDAFVLGEAVAGFVPSPGGGESVGAGAEQDGPQPPACLGERGGCLREAGNRNGEAVDRGVGVGAGVGGVEEGFQQGPRGEAVACPDVEAGEVHDGLECMLGFAVVGERDGGEPVTPGTGQVGEAAVGGQEGGEVEDRGR
jgi:hypothetical protein